MVGWVHLFLIWLSAISFLVFGSSCFFSAYMRREFARYGLARQRPLVGALQLAGATGLLVGLEFSWIGKIAAGGLAVLMLLGVGVRIKIRDTLPQIVPAFFYLLLNAYLGLVAY